MKQFSWPDIISLAIVAMMAVFNIFSGWKSFTIELGLATLCFASLKFCLTFNHFLQRCSLVYIYKFYQQIFNTRNFFPSLFVTEFLNFFISLIKGFLIELMVFVVIFGLLTISDRFNIKQINPREP